MLPGNTPPNGWKRRHVADLFDIRASGDIDWARWSSEQDALHPYPVFANGRADSGLHGYASYSVEKGDAVTLTARGTLGELGFAFFRSKAFTPIGRLLVLRSKGEADARFFTSYINGRVRFAQENTGVAQLTAPHVARYQVDLPPLAEQRAIATALSDVDALIAGLERLIAKKRDIKQAAMQQLLTGQTRLPGFSGEWELRTLGDSVQFLKNGVYARAELTEMGDMKYLHYGDIHSATSVFLDADQTVMPYLPPQKAHKLDRLQDGDLVFADASEDKDGIGKAVELRGVGNKEVVAGLHTIAARFDKEVLADGFKAYLPFMLPFSQHLKRLAAGTKVYATNRSHIASVELRLPGTKEQTAIATVLSDMDADLTALESRLAKTRAIKQGMMQELLTGRTRLV